MRITLAEQKRLTLDVNSNSALKDKKYDIHWCKKEDYYDCQKYEDCKPKKCCTFLSSPFLLCCKKIGD